jgi:hypothetical protein
MSFDKERLRREMPVLHRLNGVFVGSYIHVDVDGREVDRHQSHMHSWVDDEGRHQVNTYTWRDGRREVHRFDSGYEGGGRLRFDTDRIVGEVWEVDDRSVLLTWTRRDAPGSFFYEMAHLTDGDRERTRVWHRFQDGKLQGRVLIHEQRRPDGTPP